MTKAKKALSDRIAISVAAKEKDKKLTKSLSYKAAFIAVRQDVIEAMGDGWPLKAIWQTLHEEGKIKFKYDTFRRYVETLVPQPAPAITDSAKNLAPDTPAEQPEQPRRSIAGFNYSPTANLEDLV